MYPHIKAYNARTGLLQLQPLPKQTPENSAREKNQRKQNENMLELMLKKEKKQIWHFYPKLPTKFWLKKKKSSQTAEHGAGQVPAESEKH